MASTNRRACGPIASRASLTRSGSSSGTEPTFILTRGIPSWTQPASCDARRCGEYAVNPPEPYTGTRSRAIPSRPHRGSPSRRAFRSQIARSTAAIAIEVIPGRPRFRVCSTIATHAACGAIASRPWTTPASLEAISFAVETSAYVYPRPHSPPPRACTTTIVVASHASVPSASGASVGIV